MKASRDHKSVNLQYITLVCLDDGPNKSSSKHYLFFHYFLKAQGRCTPWNFVFPVNRPPWKEVFPDITPPRANGHYHPLAISFPNYWIPWSVIGIRFPKANGHYLPPDIVPPGHFRTLSSLNNFQTLSSPKKLRTLSPPKK